MRVLLEYKNMRVDLKDPINLKGAPEETVSRLESLIHQALEVVGKDRR